MLLNDEQKLGIKHGIMGGFINGGYALNDRDQFLIETTVNMTIEVIETMFVEANAMRK